MNGVRIGIRRIGNEPTRTLLVVMNKKVELGVSGALTYSSNSIAARSLPLNPEGSVATLESNAVGCDN